MPLCELQYYRNLFEAKKRRLILNGMSLNPADYKEVAFDNFDRYVEIVSRKDTFRDNFGVVYEISSSATQESANF